MEANLINASDAYFKARPNVNTDGYKTIFSAGYKRAWQAATEQSQKEIELLLNQQERLIAKVDKKDARIAELESDNNDYLKELAACRDVFELNDEISNFDAISDPLCIADYVNAHVKSIIQAQNELKAREKELVEAIEEVCYNRGDIDYLRKALANVNNEKKG